MMRIQRSIKIRSRFLSAGPKLIGRAHVYKEEECDIDNVLPDRYAQRTIQIGRRLLNRKGPADADPDRL